MLLLCNHIKHKAICHRNKLLHYGTIVTKKVFSVCLLAPSRENYYKDVNSMHVKSKKSLIPALNCFKFGKDVQLNSGSRIMKGFIFHYRVQVLGLGRGMFEKVTNKICDLI